MEYLFAWSEVPAILLPILSLFSPSPPLPLLRSGYCGKVQVGHAGEVGTAKRE